MNAKDASRWVDAYVKAWDSNRPDDIAALFTEDAEYFTEPYGKPWKGREDIVREWIERKDEPGDAEFRYEVMHASEDTAFVRGWTKYFTDPPREYSNLWVIGFAEDGRAAQFTEWYMKHR